jgi:hypothetical protein
MPSTRRSSGFPVIAAVVTFTLLSTAACATRQTPITSAKSDAAAGRVRVSEDYGKVPLSFEANRGQTDEQVKFLARGSRSTLFLTSSEAVLVFATREQPAQGSLHGARLRRAEDGQVTRTVLRMNLVGARPEPRLMGMEELPGKANYFIGNDPGKWRTNVPTFAKVHYENLYPGIDLVYYGNQGQLEYDLVVRPGADPKEITLGFQGADKLELDNRGDLLLHTATGTIRQRKPFIYQEIEGARREIAGGYLLKGAHRLGFQIAAYDQSRPLVIDPALFYSTYLGGSGLDGSGSAPGVSIAVDDSGNAYVTGTTGSTDFPTTAGAFQPTFGGGYGSNDAFVTKLNPTGSGLVYSTYLGGSGNYPGDVGRAIAVDALGNAYVTGVTNSADFPTTAGAFQTTANGGAFVTKLDPTGSALVYSTYFTIGSTSDLAVDTVGNAYLTGQASSALSPTPGAFQTTPSGLDDAHVTKLNSTGSALVYSTYLGGSSSDRAISIAVDTLGNAYVVGDTFSTDFPTTPGAFQPGLVGAPGGFVTKLNPLGTGLVYSTYLSGTGGATPNGIAIDTSANAYVTGTTCSTDFPTTLGAFQPTFAGDFGACDAFVTKLNSTGSALAYSTYLGGTGQDAGRGIAVDTAGNAYVTGTTESADFPTTPGTIQRAFGGSIRDVFVSKLNPLGSGLVYSTYLGGSGQEGEVSDIAVDTLPNPNAYVVGFTDSADFPVTPGAFQSALRGGFDFFVVKIADVESPAGPFTERVTGGGTIDVVGGIGSFHLIVQRQTDGTLSGRLQYFNHASGARVQSVTITSLTIAANTATFDGTCTVNGAPCTFRVNVTDNGEPGTNDTFTISVSGGPTEGGILRSGNILITQ